MVQSECTSEWVISEMRRWVKGIIQHCGLFGYEHIQIGMLEDLTILSNKPTNKPKILLRICLIQTIFFLKFPNHWVFSILFFSGSDWNSIVYAFSCCSCCVWVRGKIVRTWDNEANRLGPVTNRSWEERKFSPEKRELIYYWLLSVVSWHAWMFVLGSFGFRVSIYLVLWQYGQGSHML